jgi:hypothetical protein
MVWRGFLDRWLAGVWIDTIAGESGQKGRLVISVWCLARFALGSRVEDVECLVSRAK